MYPSLALKPGSYNGHFHVDGRWLPGEIELGAGRAVKVQIIDDERRWEPGSFPQDMPVIHRLEGRLWSNQDLALFGVSMDKVFPGRYVGFAAFALAGLQTNSALDHLTRMEVQIEGLDEFFDFAPLIEVHIPQGDGRIYSAELSTESEMAWAGSGVTIESKYACKLVKLDFYNFHVSFAPVMSFDGDPMTADEWLDQWLRPFASLLSFAAGKVCRPTWVRFTGPADDRGMRAISVQLFGSGITQLPYDATKPIYYEEGDKPLFTRKTLPTDLPAMIKRWVELQKSENPFPELVRLATFQDLPTRARFLYLVQALEALHTVENETHDLQRQEKHDAARARLLAEIEEALGRPLSSAKKDLISKKPMDSLDRRIDGLLAATPEPVVHALRHDSSDPVVNFYREEGKTIRFAEVVRRLRNDLSHGNHMPENLDLQGWVQRVDVLARAQMLRLMGFSPEQIGERLGGSA